MTCDEKIKVLSSQNVLLWIFLKKRYIIWRYADLNRLLVGSGQIPLNIELKQDDYTVCCSHTVVWSLLTGLFRSVLLEMSIWTYLSGPVYLYPSIWARLFGPVYLDPSIWYHLFLPIYLDLYIWTILVGLFNLTFSTLTHIFRPIQWSSSFGHVNLDPSFWTPLFEQLCFHPYI